MARVALVTGGTRGIGAAISAALRDADYQVAANYGGNDEAANEFKEATGIPVYKWDVGDFAACQSGIAQVEADLGPIEVLVNNDRVAERIANPELTHELPEVIAEGAYYGMETFDQSLLRLAGTGVVTFEEAMSHASKPSDLRLKAQQLGIVAT